MDLGYGIVVSGSDLLKYAVGAASLASLAVHTVTEGIPRLTARALPLIVAGVDKASDWLLAHPKVQAAVVAHEPEIQAVLDGLSDAAATLAKAAKDEAEKRLQEAAVNAKAPPAITPPSVPPAKPQEAGQAPGVPGARAA